MADQRVVILAALEDGPLPRHLPPHAPGRSIERACSGVRPLRVASVIGELRSGAWPLVEEVPWGRDVFRITDGGRAQLAWVREVDGAA